MKKTKKKLDIRTLLTGYLAEVEQRVSPATFDRHRGVLFLFETYLERYWPEHEDVMDDDPDAKYCDLYGAKDLLKGYWTFLGSYLPEKFLGRAATEKAAPSVLKQLAEWLVRNGHVKDAKSAIDTAKHFARERRMSEEPW